MNSEQPDFTQNEWLQREAQGDPKLMELLIRREHEIEMLAAEGQLSVLGESPEFSAVIKAIQRRKTELGIDPLNEP